MPWPLVAYIRASVFTAAVTMFTRVSLLIRYMSARDLNVTAKHFRFDEELDDLAASVGMTTGGTTKSASFRKRQAESSSSRRSRGRAALSANLDMSRASAGVTSELHGMRF